MSKKRKPFIPDFGAKKSKGRPDKPGDVLAAQSHAPPPPQARIKPQAIPVKSSGHRGV